VRPFYEPTASPSLKAFHPQKPLRFCEFSLIMLSVERALLIINRRSGTGQSEPVAVSLTSLFKRGLDQLSQVQVESVSDHATARACAAAFMSQSEAPAFIVTGGGGGTLRSVIEGVCDSHAPAELPEPQRVVFGALRMGSGNLLARQLGVPKDPVFGLKGLLASLKAGRTAHCCVMRCETWTSTGTCEVHYAVSLGGLGQFGKIPSDLERWHARFPVVRKYAAGLFGLERINNLEYTLAVLKRSISSMLSANGAETVIIQFQNQTERLQLLSGVVMNFPVAVLPFKPAKDIEDEALSVYLIPHRGKWSPLLQIIAPQRLLRHTRSIRIENSERLEIRFDNHDRVEFFLDEDPVTTCGQLRLGVAGSIAFVPGPDYQSNGNQGVF
jgi:diacylglycerol kinase family enzyme